jgi:hypothetical protein
VPVLVTAGGNLPVSNAAFIRSFMARQGVGGMLLMGAPRFSR